MKQNGFSTILLIILILIGVVAGTTYIKGRTGKDPYVNDTSEKTDRPGSLCVFWNNGPNYQRYSISLPDTWKIPFPYKSLEATEDSKLPAERDDRSKIGAIRGFKPSTKSCSDYIESLVSNQTRVLDKWTESINGTKWYTAQTDVACQGECIWNEYCNESDKGIFTMYISHGYVQSNEDLVKQVLSSFSLE